MLLSLDTNSLVYQAAKNYLNDHTSIFPLLSHDIDLLFPYVLYPTSQRVLKHVWIEWHRVLVPEPDKANMDYRLGFNGQPSSLREI